jgi:hypothetical protein
VDLDHCASSRRAEGHPSWVGETSRGGCYGFSPGLAFLPGRSAALLLPLATLARNFFVPSNACGSAGARLPPLRRGVVARPCAASA